jgi:TnpA family transposase
MGRELNKGEASHDLSRFLCFGKEGALRGREFGDQIQTFSCLSVLHNAVVAWNTLHIGNIVGQLRAEGQVIDDDILGLTTPLFRTCYRTGVSNMICTPFNGPNSEALL